MRRKTGALAAMALTVFALFALSVVLESSAWARAGGGGSSGSRGSRSFSSPAMPSRPSPSPQPARPPGMGTPSPTPFPGSPGAGMGRSTFWSGVAGGVAGGMLGSMLFGGRSYAAPGAGGFGGTGIGLFEILIIGALIYFGMRFFRRRRVEQGMYYDGGSAESYQPYGSGASYEPPRQLDEVTRGFEEIRRFDPSFNEDAFRETAQDLFFRIQAAWMNRGLDGIERLITTEMAEYFSEEFARMRRLGTVNRLENIAVRKVEPSEVWQESGKEYITVLFTANLLDYTLDEVTGQVVQGDKLNPVKFQEFWTFSRDIGTRQWQLAAINQIGEPSSH